MRVFIPPPNRSPGLVDALGLAGLIGLLVARYIPIAKLIPFWGCMLREQTGWPCLGCGLTRVADHVSHFHVLKALEVNPLGTVFALLFAAMAVMMILHLAFKVPVPEVVLSLREWQWVRRGLPLAILCNYAYVVVKTKFPHLLM